MKLIWSFDIFGETDELHRRSASAIETLTARGAWTIQPVVLVSQFSLLPIQAPCPSAPAETATRVCGTVRDRLSNLAREYDLKNLQPAQVILRRYHPLRAEVRELLDYAHDENANLIFTATRARMGWHRWLTGSFTENLVYLSDIPVFLLNPGCEMHVRFNRIAFPTEIKSDFEEILSGIVSLAETLKSEITVFIRPTDQDIPAERVERWTELARKAHVLLRFHSHSTGDFVDSVLKYAHENADLIAYCERSRQEDSWLLARDTRRIIQGSPCPVLVFYPDRARRAARARWDHAA